MKKRMTNDAVEMLDRLTGDDPQLRQMIAEEALNAHVARMIYELRTQAGLTQQQLARLAHTTQPVIARLEDADYGGRSLSMLQRIATALGGDIAVTFVGRAPTAKRKQSLAPR